jgi:DNA-binding Xre family transcriptional regulator
MYKNILNIEYLIKKYERENNITLTFLKLVEFSSIKSTNTWQKLVKGKWKHLTLNNINGMCELFKCTPKDLFK